MVTTDSSEKGGEGNMEMLFNTCTEHVQALGSLREKHRGRENNVFSFASGSNPLVKAYRT